MLLCSHVERWKLSYNKDIKYVDALWLANIVTSKCTTYVVWLAQHPSYAAYAILKLHGTASVTSTSVLESIYHVI